MAHLLTRNDVIVLVAVISPYQAIRQEVRQQIGAFMEVYVNAPVAICQQRDVKGLYKQAQTGEIVNFTGVSDPYEVSLQPEVICNTDLESIETSVSKVLQSILGRSS